MDFKDLIQQLAERIAKQQDLLQTEEATKNAFIMPLIAALGYDIFDPTEVIPEYTCDAGIKKGEKIDYAIMQDGCPILLIECKHCKQDLAKHDSQLLRYFGVSKARFAILTNGVNYRFYTDLEKQNVMDEKPFFDIDITNLKDNQIEELKKFHKSYFNENTILSTAAELQTALAIKDVLQRDFIAPSEEFVRYFVKATNDGKYSAKQVEQYTSLVKKAIGNYINDVIADRLGAAISVEEKSSEPKAEAAVAPQLPEGVVSITDDGVVTTQDEIDAYMIIKNIARQVIPDVSRIIFKDYKSYATISLDKEWNWFVRIYMGTGRSNSYISFFDVEKGKGERDKTLLKSLDEIYAHSDKIIESLKAVIK